MGNKQTVFETDTGVLSKSKQSNSKRPSEQLELCDNNDNSNQYYWSVKNTGETYTCNIEMFETILKDVLNDSIVWICDAHGYLHCSAVKSSNRATNIAELHVVKIYSPDSVDKIKQKRYERVFRYKISSLKRAGSRGYTNVTGSGFSVYVCTL